MNSPTERATRGGPRLIYTRDVKGKSLAHPENQPLIHRLPSEILAKIFICRLPNRYPFHFLSAENAPLLLCNICSFWRRLATSTPQLWKAFVYNTGEEMGDPDRFIEGIHTWLKRSGALPLTIHINQYYGNSPEHTTELRLLCAALSEYASRWEDVRIFTRAPFAARPSLGDLPLLHTLRIGSTFDRGALVHKFPFDSVPRLTVLEFADMPVTPAAISGVPWDQLTVLNVYEEVTLLRVVEILECCPRLESLSLKNFEHNPDSGTLARRRITQNALRMIEFQLPDDCPIFQLLTLPALANVNLYSRYKDAAIRSFTTELVDCFSRSKCKLEKLTFRSGISSEFKILECLKHKSCESLTHLYLTNSPLYGARMVEDELLVLLTYAEDKPEGPLCPKLSRLEMEHCCSPVLTPGFLGEMVCSRRFGCPEENRLNSFSLTVFEPPNEEDQALLEKAKEDGLVFSLKLSERGDFEDESDDGDDDDEGDDNGDNDDNEDTS